MAGMIGIFILIAILFMIDGSDPYDWIRKNRRK